MALYDPQEQAEIQYILEHGLSEQEVQQRKNLAKLADALFQLPTSYKQFHMGCYFSGREEVYEKELPCGTSACAVGHGPLFVEPMTKNEHDQGNWGDYCKRVFGVTVETALWDFLFSAYWETYHDTPRKAARRIYFYLKKGTPASFSTYEKHPRFHKQTPVDWMGRTKELVIG